MKSKLMYFCLTIPKHEMEIIRKKANDADMSISRYFRLAALDAVLKQPVTADVPVLINEIRKTEVILDKILNEKGQVDAADKEKIEAALKQLLQTEDLIREAYVYKWQ